MDVIPRNDYGERCQFDAYCKLVLYHEAMADAARLARQTRRRPTKMGEMGMFSGMMYCADCGSIMYQCIFSWL